MSDNSLFYSFGSNICFNSPYVNYLPPHTANSSITDKSKFIAPFSKSYKWFLICNENFTLKNKRQSNKEYIQ